MSDDLIARLRMGVCTKPAIVGAKQWTPDLIATVKVMVDAADRIAALEAQLAAARAGRVTVRALEWEELDGGVWSAKTIFNEVRIEAGWKNGKVALFSDFGTQWLSTVDEAKAAYWAEYQPRILSALTPAPAADPVAEAARVLLEDLAYALDPMAHGDKSVSVKRWTLADDAAEKAPTYLNRPTFIQMLRAALRAITEASHE